MTIQEVRELINIIRTETQDGANTAVRVADTLDEMVSLTVSTTKLEKNIVRESNTLTQIPNTTNATYFEITLTVESTTRTIELRQITEGVVNYCRFINSTANEIIMLLQPIPGYQIAKTERSTLITSGAQVEFSWVLIAGTIILLSSRELTVEQY